MAFTSQAHTTTGEKTIISVDKEKFIKYAVDATSDAVYEIQFRLDSAGIRHPLKSSVNGNTNGFLVGVDGIGINVTTADGTVTFEVLDNLDLSAI